MPRPAGATVPPDPGQLGPRQLDPGRLDLDRRQVLQELSSLIAGAVAEAQVLTAAALRFDRPSLAQAASRLAEMGADPRFDLGPINEIYRGLRRAIIDRQPGQSVPSPDGTGAGAADLPPEMTDAAAALSRMLVTRSRAPGPPSPRVFTAEAGVAPTPLRTTVPGSVFVPQGPVVAWNELTSENRTP